VKRVKANRIILVGVLGLTFFLILAVFASHFARPIRDGHSWVGWGPLETDLALSYFPAPPGEGGHVLGTDDRGRDVMARLIHGTRVSLGFSLSVWFLSYSFGILLGALMGYLGGVFDSLGQRLAEIFESIPYLFFVMFAISILGGSFYVLVIVNALFGWMMICLYIRGQVAIAAKASYVESVKALGASRQRVLFCHVLPNSIFPALIFSPLALASYVATLVQLDFLGMGLEPPTASWGELFAQANRHFPEAWWLLVFPGLCVLAVLVSFQLIGHGVQARSRR